MLAWSHIHVLSAGQVLGVRPHSVRVLASSL
jgi:hypothetical protein